MVVLVFLWGAECRPIRQDVLAGEDFLAFLMRSHRPRSQQIVHPPPPAPPSSTPVQTVPTTTTETGPTETETMTATTALEETEPPSVVSVRVSSSVRKEALHDNNVNSVLPAAATRSHFGVETTGYREAEEKILEDSVAEATQDFPSAKDSIDKKPYAEALTFEESGLGYESRVSSETSQSRVYFSRPQPVDETVVVQTSQAKKFEPQIVAPAQTREERKFVPRYQNTEQESQQPDTEVRQYSTQSIVSQTREERHYNPHNLISQNRENRQQFSNQQIISQSNHERQFESQKVSPNPQSTEVRDYRPQQQIAVDQQFATQPPVAINQHQDGQYQPQSQQTDSAARSYEAQHVERNYEQPEENYEVDEAISVMTNGRAHGVQTERPQSNNKFGQVQEGRNYRKYRVEEKTPDGFIVGEYGVVSHDDGGVRGVRYTADGSINPRLIYEALVKFLSLK